MAGGKLKIPGRRYRTLPITSPGYEDITLDLDLDKTALAVMHCWNIGCECGPAWHPDYWVGMGFPQTIEEAGRIMREVIKPAMEAARRAGLSIAHIESEFIGMKHPEAQKGLIPPKPPSEPSSKCEPGPGPRVPGYVQSIVDSKHGRDYANNGPYSKMDRAKIVEPLPGEIYAFRTDQLDRLLRERGIENLLYTGFATDMCVLNAPGGLLPMFSLGYRVHLVRDATIGVEFPDTFEERLSTRWGIRFHESHFGDSLASADLIAALHAALEERGK
ncbi:MAG TPA: cysteine hydrolase family protein [Candidatus Brocadiia bacterium]|nr:cysteine hydrolase family protein [Candidatus Brocadiia bacterium]